MRLGFGRLLGLLIQFPPEKFIFGYTLPYLGGLKKCCTFPYRSRVLYIRASIRNAYIFSPQTKLSEATVYTIMVTILDLSEEMKYKPACHQTLDLLIPKTSVYHQTTTLQYHTQARVRWTLKIACMWFIFDYGHYLLGAD